MSHRLTEDQDFAPQEKLNHQQQGHVMGTKAGDIAALLVSVDHWSKAKRRKSLRLFASAPRFIRMFSLVSTCDVAPTTVASVPAEGQSRWSSFSVILICIKPAAYNWSRQANKTVKWTGDNRRLNTKSSSSSIEAAPVRGEDSPPSSGDLSESRHCHRSVATSRCFVLNAQMGAADKERQSAEEETLRAWGAGFHTASVSSHWKKSWREGNERRGLRLPLSSAGVPRCRWSGKSCRFLSLAERRTQMGLHNVMETSPA